MANDPFGKAIPLKQTAPFGAPVPVASQEPFDLTTGKGAMAYSQSQARKAIPQPQLSKEDRLVSDLQSTLNAPTPVETAYGQGKSGDYAGAAHTLISGAGKAMLPLGAAAFWEAPVAATLGTLGGVGGGYGTKKLAEHFGANPSEANLAGDVGGIAGGVAGGSVGTLLEPRSGVRNAVASLLRNPATGRQSLIGRPGTVKSFLPSSMQRWTVPDWLIPRGDLGTPTNPGPFSEFLGKTAAPELGSPENPGLLSKIPTGRRSLPPNPQEGLAEFMSSGYRPMMGPGPEDMPASEAQRAAFQNRGYRSSAEIARQEAAALPPVVQVPEPSPGTPLTREGAMWSIKRGKLLPLAQSGQPGAIDVLKNLGVRPLIIPRGADIESPSLAGLGGQQLLPPASSPAPIPKIGEGTSAVNLVEGEAPRTNPSQIMASQAFERTRLQSVLNNPNATAEEKAIAARALRAGFGPR